MKKLAVLLFAASCSGCTGMSGSSNSFDNVERVRIGMSEQELIAIMGKPDLTRNHGDGKQVWVWRNPMALTGLSVVSFGLKDGKVSEIPNVAALR
jgi:hypothetical protein